MAAESNTTTPCYVFRLIKFDEQGSKIQKRKYGFTAKSASANELDENVFNGIITRAEQTFNLRPSSYSLYLVLGSNSTYTHELGETDLHLDDYPALSSHSWTALHSYHQFSHKKELIANLKADKKGRKVVNLCLVQTTLHDAARLYKLHKGLQGNNHLSNGKHSKVKGKGKEETETVHPQEAESGSTSTSKIEVSSASSSVGEGEDYADADVPDPATPTIGSISPQSPSIEDKAQQEEEEGQDNEKQKKNSSSEEGQKRSTSPAAQAAQDVADLVAKFTNFIAPLPIPTAPLAPHSSASANGGVAGGNFGTHPGMEFIKRAADFIAPPASTPVAEGPAPGATSSSSSRSNGSTPAAAGINTSPIDFAASLAAAARAASASASASANARAHHLHHQASSFGKRRHWSEYLTDGLDAAYGNGTPLSTTAATASPSAIPELAAAIATPQGNTESESATSTPPPPPPAPAPAPAATNTGASIGDSLTRSMNAAIQARDRATKAREDAIKQRLEAMKQYPFGSRSFLSPRGASHHHHHQHHNKMNTNCGGDPTPAVSGAASASAAAAAASALPPSFKRATSPSSASSSTASNDKYTTLKSSFDKFVNDFNANLADAFGGPPPELAASSPPSANVNDNTKGEDEKATAASNGQSVFEARGEKETATTSQGHRHCRHAATTQREAHNATCDVCDEWIVGVRYKCFVCPDWDCCEKCVAKVDQVHPGHALAALQHASDLIRRKDTPLSYDSSTTRHFAIHCDGCNKPIYGIRYKCTHQSCPDFDLCATCEADPLPYNSNKKIGNHSYRDHLMVKIRKPIVFPSSLSSFGAVTANRVQLQRAVENARKAVSASAGTSGTTPATSRGNASTPSSNNVVQPAKEDKTCIIDVPLPFAIPGGQKDIHLTFDIGTNEKGETVILNHNGASASIAEAIQAAFKEASSASTAAKASPAAPATAATPRSDKATTVSEDETAVQPVKPVQQKSQMVDARMQYDARWVNDVTFGDGESVFPGTVFNKVWDVENTGTKAWPEGTRLICVSGFGKDTTSQHGGRKEISYTVKPALPGARVHIVAEDITAPEIGGKFMSYYRFVAPDGTRFGDRLWIDIIVDGDQSIVKSKTCSSDAQDGSKLSSSSLDSSRVVTPTLKVKGSTTTINQDGIPESVATSTAVSEAITSPRSTVSGLLDTENISVLSDSLDDEEEDCDFVLLSDDDEYDQV